MATNGHEARKQADRKMFPGRIARHGHVPRADGLNPIAAPTFSSLQRNGWASEPKFYGLPIAPILRFMSAIGLLHNVNATSFRALILALTL